MRRKPSHAMRKGMPAETGTVPPPSGIDGLVDEVRATVLALLASLQAKERELCERAGARPSPGLARGLSDIYALRRWADRTLRTIEEVDRKRGAGLDSLIGDLSEFTEILRTKQPSLPSEPPMIAAN